jgi:hypothetical protein
VRPYDNSVPTVREITCMQLTDRRVYFTWEDARRRDLALFEDEENARELSPTITPPLDEPFHGGLGLEQLGVVALGRHPPNHPLLSMQYHDATR